MKLNCVFDSLFGYNSVVRLGKIYTAHKQHYVYLLRTNDDLINYRSIFTEFFRICKHKLKQKIFLFFLNHKDLYHREIGRSNIQSFIDKYYRIYFGQKVIV
jgi:hypothetical protein